jgi:hypothetical protein
MTNPLNNVWTYSWDLQNRLTGIQNYVPETTTITWDALGRESHRVFGNGQTMTATFDPAGRQTGLPTTSTAAKPPASTRPRMMQLATGSRRSSWTALCVPGRMTGATS